MQMFILSGGPGCGKSSVLLELEHTHNCFVVHEAAESIIRLEQAHGRKYPWDFQGFQRKIWNLQHKRIQNIPLNTPKVFLDRYYVDSIAYSHDNDAIPELPKDFQKNLDTSIPVFFFENLGFFETEKYRKEDAEYARDLEKRIYENYKHYGYKIIDVAKDTVKNRAQFILNKINDLK